MCANKCSSCALWYRCSTYNKCKVDKKVEGVRNTPELTSTEKFALW